MRALDAAAFSATLLGSFYVSMTFSFICHEALGISLMNAVFGADYIYFQVTPRFTGWAQIDFSLSSFESTVVSYSGIGMNALVGLSAVTILYVRRDILNRGALVLFWVAVTQLGHALGHVLEGVLLGRGEASQLARLALVPRWTVAVLLGATFLALARFALANIARWAHEQFEPTRQREFTGWMLATFALPIACLVAAIRGAPSPSLSTRLLFDGTIVLVVLGTVILAPRLWPPPPTSPPAIRFRWYDGLIWATLAIGTYLLVSRFLAGGVRLSV